MSAPAPAEAVRLCIEALDARSLGASARRALAVAVTGWLGPEALDSTIEAVLTTELQRRPRAVDAPAMDAWFGAGAADVAPDHDPMEAFARSYGPEHAVRLVDVAATVAATSGGIGISDVRRLDLLGARLLVDPLVVSAIIRRRDPRYAEGIRYPLDAARVVLGSGAGCDLILPDPQVLPLQVELVRGAGGWRVMDVARARPVRVGGRPVSSAPLLPGTALQVGPFELRLDGDTLVGVNRRGLSALEVDHLTQRVDGRVVVDDVSFTLAAGEVIAVIGPSGGGKTSMVNAIQGTTPLDAGQIRLDGEPLHALLRAQPTLAGAVPQDDLVIPALTVEEMLRAAARVRFGSDEAELDRAVEAVLTELDLRHVRDRRIGDALRRGISGGQRKRVSLGQELLGRATRLLFLDEPTSGLDPAAAQDIVQLLRRLADNGRIVVLVSHDLTPEVVAQVDHLLVLAPGGRLAWFGPPAEACAWFGVGTADALFYRLGDRTPEAWRDAYLASDAARRYLHTRACAVRLGLLGGRVAQGPPRAGAGRQLRTLVTRYALSKTRDATGLLVLLAQAPVLAAVMATVYPGVAAGTVFVLTLSCMWFGLFSGVRELIVDRVLWRRERALGVGVLPYVGSKAIVLGALTAVQCAVMVGLCWLAMPFDANGFDVAGLLGVCTLTSWAGLGLGLLVSAAWTSSEAAVGTLPILVVPQILFSSILVSIRHMDAVSRALAWLTVQRYALDAALKCGETVEQASQVSASWERRAVTGALYHLGLKPAEAEAMGLSLAALTAALAGWALVFLAATAGVVWARDRVRWRRRDA